MDSRHDTEALRYMEDKAEAMEEVDAENEEPQKRQVRVTRRTKLPVEEKLDRVMRFSSTPACVKGQEGQYLHQLLLRYQDWFRNELEARASFDEVAASLEKMGRKREIRVR